MAHRVSRCQGASFEPSMANRNACSCPVGDVEVSVKSLAVEESLCNTSYPSIEVDLIPHATIFEHAAKLVKIAILTKIPVVVRGTEQPFLRSNLGDDAVSCWMWSRLWIIFQHHTYTPRECVNLRSPRCLKQFCLMLLDRVSVSQCR